MKRSPAAAARALAQVALLVVLAGLAAACGGTRTDPILQLSAQEALARGKELIEQKKYRRAQRYLEHAFEAAPNSREGREALLLSADALYLDGGSENFIRCESKYRDFLNRFPTSDRADYAQLQIANCLAKRMEKPDRDQEVTRKALAAYEEMFRLYPTSPYLEEARQAAQEVANNLAEAEYLVGHFYVRYRLCQAAIQRLEGIPLRFPAYHHPDKVLFFLAQAYAMCRRYDDSDEALRKLAADYPDSPYVKQVDKVRRKLEKLRRKQEKLDQERLKRRQQFEARRAKKGEAAEGPDSREEAEREEDDKGGGGDGP